MMALTSVSLTVSAQIGLSPSRFDLELKDKPTTESIRVFNFGKEPVDIQVSVITWDLDETNSIRVLPPNEQSLDQWLVINPLRFSIAAQSSQTVRFSIRPRVEPEPGEHRATIYFKQLPPPTPSKSARFLYNVGITIYAQVGETTRHLEIEQVDLKGGQVRLRVSSLGTANVRFEGQYSIWPADRYPGEEATAIIEDLEEEGLQVPEPILEVGKLPVTPVLPGTTRTLSIPLASKLEPGSYVIDLNGVAGDEQIDASFSLQVEPEAGEAVGSEPDQANDIAPAEAPDSVR
jgi:P pilus assembly chaperone PapD